MEQFNVEKVMHSLQREIREKGLCTEELSHVTSYHNKLIKKLRLREELVIFGAGTFGKRVVEDLKQHGISGIQCFCDNSAKVIGKRIGEFEVLSPEKAWKSYPDACFVITTKWYENEILSQLIHMGVSIDNILTFNLKLAGLEY